MIRNRDRPTSINFIYTSSEKRAKPIQVCDGDALTTYLHARQRAVSDGEVHVGNDSVSTVFKTYGRDKPIDNNRYFGVTGDDVNTSFSTTADMILEQTLDVEATYRALINAYGSWIKDLPAIQQLGQRIQRELVDKKKHLSQ